MKTLYNLFTNQQVNPKTRSCVYHVKEEWTIATEVKLPACFQANNYYSYYYTVQKLMILS